LEQPRNPRSTTLDFEDVVVRPFKVIATGRLTKNGITLILTTRHYKVAEKLTIALAKNGYEPHTYIDYDGHWRIRITNLSIEDVNRALKIAHEALSRKSERQIVLATN